MALEVIYLGEAETVWPRSTVCLAGCRKNSGAYMEWEICVPPPSGLQICMGNVTLHLNTNSSWYLGICLSLLNTDSVLTPQAGSVTRATRASVGPLILTAEG
jgi:hypothetical protein